jgi:uncharacterized protein YcbK (DUF882 family)
VNPMARAIVLLTCLILPSAISAEPEARRYFFTGDGRITLESGHDGNRLEAQFRRLDGSYDDEAFARIVRFLRSRGDDREGEISLRLVEQLDYLEDMARPRGLRLASGYRSPEYNDSVRARGGQAASASLHTQGLAADLQFVGVDTRRLWLRVRELGCCGVGYYADGNFLHVDVGPPRFWEAATSGVGKNLSGGNARVFARTDFDRYPRLVGALVRVHSVTAFPLRVAAAAQAVAAETQHIVRLVPEGDVRLDGDCLRIDGAGRHLLRVAAAEALPTSRRLRLRLAACPPRVERTPPSFESNEFELRSDLNPG